MALRRFTHTVALLPFLAPIGTHGDEGPHAGGYRREFLSGLTKDSIA